MKTSWTGEEGSSQLRAIGTDCTAIIDKEFRLLALGLSGITTCRPDQEEALNAIGLQFRFEWKAAPEGETIPPENYLDPTFGREAVLAQEQAPSSTDA